jgi:hypothetical protein
MSGITTDGAAYWASILFDLESPPAQYYVAVVNYVPDETADGTQISEPEDAAYSRVSVSTGSGSWVVNNASSVQNSDDIVFPTPTEDWGSIEGFVFCLSSTPESGDQTIICWGEFDQPVYVRSGVPLIISAGSIAINLGSQADTISL